MQLWFVRCIAMYCGAADERGSFPQPSLGVSSLDLGRSETRTAYFFAGICGLYSAAARGAISGGSSAKIRAIICVRS